LIPLVFLLINSFRQFITIAILFILGRDLTISLIHVIAQQMQKIRREVACTLL